jgi:pentapeptide MXKDX repeat protein
MKSMKKLTVVSFAIALLFCVGAFAQDTMKKDDSMKDGDMKQDTMKSENTASIRRSQNMKWALLISITFPGVLAQANGQELQPVQGQFSLPVGKLQPV